MNTFADSRSTPPASMSRSANGAGEQAPHAEPVLYSVDFSDCEALAAIKTEEITATFITTMVRAGASIVQALSHTFPGAGLTCVLILRESHAVVHTWPETGTVNVDIFSCSSKLKSRDAIDELSRFFGAGRVSVQEMIRADGHLPQTAPQRLGSSPERP